MANVAALRTALTRMGLSVEAAHFATDEMALSSMEDWRDLRMDDDALAKSFRTPGGTILNADGDEVRHPGVAVSLRALSNLKIMRLALKHFQHISRTVVVTDITVPWINTWEFLVDFKEEADKKTPKISELPKLNMDDWPKNKIKVFDHLSEVYGQGGIPLSYVL